MCDAKRTGGRVRWGRWSHAAAGGCSRAGLNATARRDQRASRYTEVDLTDPAHPLIAPHGGTLVDRTVDRATAAALLLDAGRMPKIPLSERSLCDVICIAV